ncbi:MAG: SDR family oxidoreductase, partial [Bacteroidetes bacterium]|nr:SDR family oxidoreductase [Bacteroidota bacterium]
LFVQEGAKVCFVDIDETEGKEAETMLEHSSACFLHCDVTDSQQIERAVNICINKFGTIHFLINNAGIIRYNNAITCPEEEWDLVMNVNLKSYFLTTKYVLPYICKNQGGVVVNIASAQSFISSANMVHYTTSKSALLGFTRSIAIDFAPEVRAVAVCPGTVDTPMARNAWAQDEDPERLHEESKSMHLLNRIAQPEEIASLILYLCSDKAAFITGQAFRIDGGLGISVPGSVEEKIEL